MWSQIEITASIVCACLPPLKPLFCLVFGGFLGPCEETCGSSMPGRRMAPLHVDSALQESFVQAGSEDVLAHGIGSKEKGKDLESAVESVDVENDKS